MKASIEAKVAAAVGAAFVALTVGAIAQGNSGSAAGSPSGYARPNSTGVSVPAEQLRISSGDETATTSTGSKSKNLRSRKHHTQHIRQNQRTETNEPENTSVRAKSDRVKV